MAALKTYESMSWSSDIKSLGNSIPWFVVAPEHKSRFGWHLVRFVVECALVCVLIFGIVVSL